MAALAAQRYARRWRTQGGGCLFASPVVVLRNRQGPAARSIDGVVAKEAWLARAAWGPIKQRSVAFRRFVAPIVLKTQKDVVASLRGRGQEPPRSRFSGQPFSRFRDIPSSVTASGGRENIIPPHTHPGRADVHASGTRSSCAATG